MTAVLLIEDNETQRMVAGFALRKVGYVVHEARDGAEGLAMIRELRPDAVVCDVVMPNMNGYQLVAAVRKEAPIAGTPVILLTSLSERTQMRLGMTSGADDYLVKPVQPGELQMAVEAVLDRRSTQQEALLHSLHADFAAALEHQQQALAAKYEHQLLRELNSRWSRSSQNEAQQAFQGATLLVADLFGHAFSAAHAGGQPGELAQRAFQAARDSLYLFGAALVLPYGGELLALFDPADDRGTVPAPARAARAAFALQSATVAPSQQRERPPLTVAIHSGNVTLVKLDDVLHGDAGSAPVPGPSLQFAAALRSFATRHGWRVAVSEPVMAQVPSDVAQCGQRADLGGTPVCELLAA